MGTQRGGDDKEYGIRNEEERERVEYEKRRGWW